MAVSLKRALIEILSDWPDDLAPEWRDACGEVELGFGNADPQFELEFWEPVFPVRRGRYFPGMPVGALRDHPARADTVLALENPFLLCNQRHREARRGALYADPDWQEFIDEIWALKAILAQDVTIMNPARFAPVVAMARV